MHIQKSIYQPAFARMNAVRYCDANSSHIQRHHCRTHVDLCPNRRRLHEKEGNKITLIYTQLCSYIIIVLKLIENRFESLHENSNESLIIFFVRC